MLRPSNETKRLYVLMFCWEAERLILQNICSGFWWAFQSSLDSPGGGTNVNTCSSRRFVGQPPTPVHDLWEWTVKTWERRGKEYQNGGSYVVLGLEQRCWLADRCFWILGGQSPSVAMTATIWRGSRGCGVCEGVAACQPPVHHLQVSVPDGPVLVIVNEQRCL